MQGDAQAILERAIPARRAARRAFLEFLVPRGERIGADQLAREISANPGAEDRPALLAYCGQRLAEKEDVPALATWNAMCRRELLPYAPLDPAGGDVVTNGDFGAKSAEAGFDWHLMEQQGVTVLRSRGELRLTFTGKQPESALVAWQFVPVVPARRYRLSYRYDTAGAPQPTGIFWAVSPAGSEEPIQTGPLGSETTKEGALTVAVPQGVRLLRLALVYIRPQGMPRLDGRLTLGGVRMELEP